MTVKVYNDEHTLTMPKNGMTIEAIDDLSKVVTKPIKQTKELIDAKVVAVCNLQSNQMRISCMKGHILPIQDNPSLGKMFDVPHHFPTFSLQVANISTAYSCFTDISLPFGQQLANIAKSPNEEVTDIQPLTSDKFNVEYDDNVTIVIVTRQP